MLAAEFALFKATMAVHSLFSAGSNARGQLASGDTEDAHAFASCVFQGQDPGVFPDGTQKVVQAACGANHTLLLLERIQGSSTNSARELWGCGDGRRGQLGPSYDVSDTCVFRPLTLDLQKLRLQEYTLRTVAASWETSYVVLSCPGRNDVLLTMGADDFGDLGVGGKGKAVPSPGLVHVVDFEDIVRPSREGIMNHALEITHMSAGSHHVVIHLAIAYADGTQEQRIVGWGTSRHGQLGAHRDHATGKPIPYITSPRLLFPPSQDGEPVVSSALGTHHTILLRSSGRLSSLGSDRKGQLDGVDSLQDVSAVGCTWNGTYAVVRRGTSWSVMSAGNHNKGQLGRPLRTSHNNPHGHPPLAVHFPFSHETHNLMKMVCGSEHVLCMFTRTGVTNPTPPAEVWGWGWNEHGNLGIGSIEDQDVPVKVWPPSTEEHRVAIDIWAGYGTSWILV